MRSWHRPPDTAPARQVVAAALTLLVLGGVGAVQAGLAGASFMYDLEQVRPRAGRARARPPRAGDPGPRDPAALIAVACAAINVALTLALEVIVFAARAWMRVPPALE